MNRLMGYLPKYYVDNVEIESITEAKIPEIEKLWEKIEEVRNNQFITTMDSNRLRLWERLLRIRPDFNKQTLQYRKEVVLLRLNKAPPFSERWLENLLNERVGVENYCIALDHNNYSLTINIIKDDLDLINENRKFLRHMIPANLVLIVKRAVVKESDKIQCVKATITKTANRHISTPIERKRYVEKTRIIKVGLTRTLNKHTGGN